MRREFMKYFQETSKSILLFAEHSKDVFCTSGSKGVVFFGFSTLCGKGKYSFTAKHFVR